MISITNAVPKMLFFLYFCASPVFADTILLKNGDRFSGSIVSYADGVCVFETNYGSAVRFPGENIKSIATDKQYDIEFINGDRATGKLSINESGQTVMHSSNFGDAIINTHSIIRITKNLAVIESKSNNSVATTKAEAAEQYGSATGKQAPLDFLTGSTVLLSPGQYELDVSTTYKQSRTQYSLQEVGYFQKSSYSARQLELRPTLRAGLYKAFEAYLSTPMTYSHVEDVSSNEYTRNSSSWQMADVGFGGQYQLTSEKASIPAVSMTLDISAPTGRKKYNKLVDAWKDPLNNGSGHWSIAPGLAFVRTSDPGILFGGIRYQYYFADTIDGYYVQPGWLVNTYMGVGFALNEKLSLGTRLSYVSSSNMKADHETIYGSDSDPMDISLNASYRFSENWVVSPGVTFGLNNDSGPAALSVNFKRQIN